jgi:hypothetical protein
MDPVAVLVLKVVGYSAGFALFIYVLYRSVLRARKMGRTGSGAAVARVSGMLFGPVIAPPPPHEVAAESRKQKRNEDDGDPPSGDQ